MTKSNDWAAVPDILRSLLSHPSLAEITKVATSLPGLLDTRHCVYYRPDDEVVFVSADVPEETAALWSEKLASQRDVAAAVVGFHYEPRPRDWGESPWVLLKRSASPPESVQDHLGALREHVVSAFKSPGPLAAALAGGVLGSGVGYLGGSLAEPVLGIEEGRLRRRAALLGGALGAAPGVWAGSVNQRLNPGSGLAAWMGEKKSEFSVTQLSEAAWAAREVLGREPAAALQKVAWSMDGPMTTGAFPIHKDEFNRQVWQDPHTSVSVKAQTTGLVDSAGMISQHGSDHITSHDVARVAVGMGVGYATGLMVGKTLGALAGLSPQAQRQLQHTGTWAGVLSAVVPRVYGT